MKKMGYDIPEYGIESLPMGEELRSLLPNIPMVSKPLLTMGTTSNATWWSKSLIEMGM